MNTLQYEKLKIITRFHTLLSTVNKFDKRFFKRVSIMNLMKQNSKLYENTVNKLYFDLCTIFFCFQLKKENNNKNN